MNGKAVCYKDHNSAVFKSDFYMQEIVVSVMIHSILNEF